MYNAVIVTKSFRFYNVHYLVDVAPRNVFYVYMLISFNLST